MRVGKGPASRRRKKALLKKAKGASRGRGNRFGLARATVWRAGRFARRDRRVRKRLFRALWIERLNAACRLMDTRYSDLIAGLGRAEVLLDRRILAHLAVTDTDTFAAIVELAKSNRGTPTRRAA